MLDSPLQNQHIHTKICQGSAVKLLMSSSIAHFWCRMRCQTSSQKWSNLKTCWNPLLYEGFTPKDGHIQKIFIVVLSQLVKCPTNQWGKRIILCCLCHFWMMLDISDSGMEWHSCLMWVISNLWALDIPSKSCCSCVIEPIYHWFRHTRNLYTSSKGPIGHFV